MPTPSRRPARGSRTKLIAGLALIPTLSLLAAGCSQPFGPITVPTQYKSFFVVAAKRCPGVLTPESLAGQAWAESGFDPSAVSPAGAEGMMQIIPAVWSTYGVDADGNGRTSPFDPADSIATAAKFNCVLAKEVVPIPGNNTQLRLAAYNAGLGAVQRYQGIPPYKETERYVERVLDATDRVSGQFSASASPK